MAKTQTTKTTITTSDARARGALAMWHGVSQLARLLDIPERSARHLCEKGLVPCKKRGGRYTGLIAELAEDLSANGGEG
jgi:hypothetical protein